MAIQSNISVSASAWPSSVFTYTDDAGEAVDLTGFTAMLLIRDAQAAEEVVVDDEGILVNGGALGTITIDWEDVADDLPEVGSYELHVVTPGGVAIELVSGTIHVSSHD